MTTDDLEDRLRRLGQTPIAPEVEASHRRTMAEAVSAPARARFGWRAVALAVVAGFFVGSTSLAAAGSLPAPAQDVAHDVLDVVGIGVPRSTEGCPEGSSYRNHGEYVSAVEASGGDVEAAAHSECGKPAHSGKAKGTDKEKGSSSASPDAGAEAGEDPCTGPPPWAGTHLDSEAKEAARAEREATCGPDDDADETEVESDDVEEEEPAPKSDATTTTTVPDDTTTTTDTAETTTTSTTQP
jgi:hypothetical protein